MIDELEQARREVALCNIDTTRGRIEPEGGGYVVVLDAPVVDIGAHIEGEIPRRITCRTAYQAELAMLNWLRRVQLAERKQIRQGRWFDGVHSMMKTQLDPSEVADYLAELAHRKQVDKLREELAEALAKKQAAKDSAADRERLAQRYPAAAAAEPVQPRRPRKTEQQLPLTGITAEE